MARGLPVQSEFMLVHVVDDDDGIRRSLAVLLRSYGYVVQTHAAGPGFLEWLTRFAVPTETMTMTCVLLDLRMPGMDGLEVQQVMLRRGVRLPVVAMSGAVDVGLAVRVMKAGAIDVIEKPYSEETLLRAITAAMARSADPSPHGISREAALAKLATLTARERDVLGSIVRGQPNKVIAHGLGISPRTVEIHRSNMMVKLECRSIAEVVKLGIQAGLV